ncbi:PAS domain S-box protein, partial [candidate division TA06 bacterium]
YDSAPAAYFSVSPDGSIIRANRAAEQFTGYTLEELKGMKTFDLYADESKEKAKELFEKFKRGYQWENDEMIYRRKDGQKVHGLLSVNRITDNEGRLIESRSVVVDITTRKLMEQDLLLFRNLMDQTKDGIFINDAETGRILDVNESACSDMGYTREELIGKRVIDFATTIPDGFSWEGHVKELREKGSMLLESGHRRKDGTEFPVEVSLRGVELGGKAYNLAVVRDITERRKTENMLRNIVEGTSSVTGEDFFRMLVRCLSEALGLRYVLVGELTSDEEEIVRIVALWNGEDFAETYEYSLKGTPCENVAGKKMCTYSQGIQELFPEDLSLVEMGAESYLGIPLFDSNDKPLGVLVVIHDKPLEEISLAQSIMSIFAGRASAEMERKRIEEDLRKSELWLSNIFNSLEEAVFVVSADRNLKNVNKATEKIFGYLKNELIGHSTEVIHVDHDHYIKFGQRIRDAFDREETANFEFESKRKNGEIFPTEHTVSLLKDDSGNVIGIVSVVRDITERKSAEEALRKAHGELEMRVKDRTEELAKTNEELESEIVERVKAEEQIKASLHEKEILLRELHHRVKNNMQVISSLLRMQAEKIKDEGYADMLRESQERIRSMSLIHESLYQSKDFANVDFKGYVGTLVNSLFRSHGVNVNKVKINMTIEDIKLDLENAIPCGLIINELVSNSLKYAFPAGREGAVAIVIHSTGGDELELVVSDNGVGIPEDVDMKGAETLGLYLVTMLAERQLEGEVEFSREGGTKCRISFKRQEYKPRL